MVSNLGHLRSISHAATESVLTDLREGRGVLSLLHDKKISSGLKTGRPAERVPHNLGFRNKSGAVSENRYKLKQPDFSHEIDPYQPKIDFDKRASYRYGGRASIQKSSRGTNFKQTVDNAFVQVAQKFKQKIHKSRPQHLDNSDVFKVPYAKKRKISGV